MRGRSLPSPPKRRGRSWPSPGVKRRGRSLPSPAKRRGRSWPSPGVKRRGRSWPSPEPKLRGRSLPSPPKRRGRSWPSPVRGPRGGRWPASSAFLRPPARSWACLMPSTTARTRPRFRSDTRTGRVAAGLRALPSGAAVLMPSVLRLGELLSVISSMWGVRPRWLAPPAGPVQAVTAVCYPRRGGCHRPGKRLPPARRAY